MQSLKALKPTHINTDVDEMYMPQDAAKFIKGLRLGGGRNANLNTGTGADLPTANNFKVLSATESNIAACNIPKPDGDNKCVGAYQSPELNKIFYLNQNSLGYHGLYMIDGDTLVCQKVTIERDFNFSSDPQHNIPAHRVHLRVVYSSDDLMNRRVKEMYFIFTDGRGWQRWVNVIAGTLTNGFDASLYPYWKTHAPHFDRAEFIDYPTRPPMFCPTYTELPPVENELGKKNARLNKSMQLAYAFLLTDGRMTTLSPYSLPDVLKGSSCNLNNTNLSRCLEFTFYAGSALVEKIMIFRRFCGGTWTLYDTIAKYTSCDENDPEIIGDEYWKRTNPWKDFSYNEATNSIKYKYCGDKECGILNAEDVNRFQTDLPIKSIAMTVAGDSIFFGNNLYFYDPLPCESLKNIKLIANSPNVGEQCSVKNVKITLYSFMAINSAGTCYAYTKGEDKTVRFGGVVVDGGGGVTLHEGQSTLFNLTFGENQGQICYLRGTPYYAIGKQYKVDSAGNKELIGLIDVDVVSQKDLAHSIISGGGIFVWQYDFIVPAGKYIATLAAHDASLTGDYQQTSEPINGVSNSMVRFGSNIRLDSIITKAKELEVDACAGDVDVWRNGKDIFHTYVPTNEGYGINDRWKYITGYLKEEKDSKVGVELMRYEATNGEQNYKRWGEVTDHNGFFFVFTARGAAKDSEVSFRGKLNCVNDGNELFHTNSLPNQSGYYPNTNINVSDNNGGSFGLCNRVLVRGKVTDCNGGAGLSGVAVTITRGGTTFTTSDGSFELIVHNSFENIRQDKIYFNASGACVFVGCNCECTPVVSYTDANNPCVNCTERIYPIEITQQLKAIVNNQKSLKRGGRYGVGIVGFDLAGRATLVNLINYIDIPTFMESGNFNPMNISWELLGSLNLPPHIKYVSFFRTKNLNYGTYLQWVGDKIEFLDTQGDVVTTPAGAVRARVTIQSLNDYNSSNGFSTLTKYQFVAGDMLRIMDDGNGNMFDPALTNGFMDYQILGTNWQDETTDDGKSFIIPYDKRLDALKDKCGFWIEIQRPKECLPKEEFCEICGIFPVKNGELLNGIDEGVLETWDTYYQSRFFQIEGCSGKSYLHPFESNSVSDFFGENCDSCGRISFRDDSVKQRWYPDDIIKSDEFVNEGGYNGLGTFREKNRKQFKGQEWGGIVGMHAERNIIFCVAQNDWFLLDYNLNVARVNAEGLLVANLDQNLSDPHQKVGSNYGCMYAHTSTIQFHNGMATWASASNRGWIMSDYRSASPISDIDNINYFIEKFWHVMDFNMRLPDEDYLNYLYEITSGIDIEGKELYVTFRPRRNATTRVDSYVNELREIKIDHQETFVFNFEQKKWTRWSELCPEFYCNVRGLRNGSTLMAFMNGDAYYQGGADAVGFNTCFGIKTEMVCDVVMVDNPNEVRVWQSIGVDSNNMKFFVDRAFTSERNSFTYIPPAYLKRKEHVFYSEFLADMNSYPSADLTQSYRSMLVDGKRTFGKFLRLRLVNDPARMGEYTELDKIVIRSMTSEKSGA